MSIPIPGKCRHCGCTEDRACTLETGDPCCWVDLDRSVCSRPVCISREAARVAAERQGAPSRYRGWGFGAIVADLRRRRSKRKKGRAA